MELIIAIFLNEAIAELRSRFPTRSDCEFEFERKDLDRDCVC